MNEAVEDRVGYRGVADLFVPEVDRQLAGNDGGCVGVSLLDDLQEVSAFLVVHGGEAEVVYYQHMCFGQLGDGFAVAAVSPGEGHLIGELGETQVEGSVSFPAHLVHEGAGEIRLADARRSGDDDVLMARDPITGNKPHHDRLVEAAGGFIVDILDAGVEFRPGIFQVPCHPVVFLPAPLTVDDQAEAFREGESIQVGLIHLVCEGFDHADEFQRGEPLDGLLIKHDVPPRAGSTLSLGCCDGGSVAPGQPPPAIPGCQGCS